MLKTSLLCCVATLASTESILSKPKNIRPNIIFILADDLGYMDVGAFASHTTGVSTDKMFFETPNIDKMTREGVAFTSAYVCPLSSPTRATLLTGKYAARIGFTSALPPRDTWYMLNRKPEGDAYVNDALYHGDDISIQQALINGKANTAIPAGLPKDQGRKEVILPEILTGYHKAFVGKWHVGGFGADGYQPSDRGFDQVLAYYDAGGSAHFNWQNSWNDKEKKRYPQMPQAEWKIGDSGDKSEFEFLTDDLTDKALKYIDDRVEKANEPFLLYFAHFAVHTPIQAKEEDISYFNSKPTKGWNRHSDPTYAALVKGLDDSVGKIFQKLEEAGIAENTLVIFLSDNGGIDSKITKSDKITNNTPYIGGKATVFEGGIKSPLIFRWKGHLRGGKWCDVVVDGCDLLPTILDFAGVDPITHIAQNKMDGQSIRPLMNDVKNSKKKYLRTEFVWHYPFNVQYNNPVDGLPLTPHSAIREGDLKLIFDWHGRIYLFDVRKDPYEANNIASLMPQKTNQIFGRLVEWFDSNIEPRYLPSKNPNYDMTKESRTQTPYIDLIDCYRRTGDVVKSAVIPDMNLIKIK